MKIIPIQNVTVIQEGNMIISEKSENNGKIIISGFQLQFEHNIENYEVDHCQCIASSIITDGNKLLFTTVTQKNDIDEYITISLKYH